MGVGAEVECFAGKEMEETASEVKPEKAMR